MSIPHVYTIYFVLNLFCSLPVIRLEILNVLLLSLFHVFKIALSSILIGFTFNSFECVYFDRQPY